ncbi:MAG TPA: IS66 family transposase, partial [Pedobacter sp.]
KDIGGCGNIGRAKKRIGLCFAVHRQRYMKAAQNYKALYNNCTEQSAQKDSLIVLLQQQLMQLAGERELLTAVIADQQEQLTRQASQIADRQATIDQQLQMIAGQDEKLSLQQTIIQEQNSLIALQQKELDTHKSELLHLGNLRYELSAIKKWVYGIRSEKRHQPADPGIAIAGDQLFLDMEIDSWGVCTISDRRKVPEHLRTLKSTTPKKPGGRHDFPAGLEEQITILDVIDKPAGARCVGHVDQRQLACDPMRWYIKVTRRPVYLVPVDEDQLNYKQLMAPLPPHPIAKCKMDTSILVMLTIEKFLYHMPVWRQQQRLRQYGVDLAYSSLCSLVNRTCETLEPLWHLLLKEITNSGLINIDETRYRVLDNTKKQGKKCHIGWMWASMNPVQGIACFMYQQGRGKKDIGGVLQGYEGFLMTDAYGAYTKYGKQPFVTHLHCLSHARRYFVYALQNDAARAGYALDHFFGPLYEIEQECKLLQLNYDDITAKRQSESLPVLHAFHEWLQKTLPQTTARTPIHKAVTYALKNYHGLLHYTTDGMLPIDNNQLEGQLRAIALGRHNHLFAGSHRGGELAAIIYSFMATCKLQKIHPSEWLDDVLRRITDQPEDKLIELLPQFWKPLSQRNVRSA